MKFTTNSVGQGKIILANNHFVAIPYDCTDVDANDEGVIVAGTIIDNVGVVLNDVYKDDNPNGTVVIHGFINRDKLPVKPEDETKFPQITFLPIKKAE
jgi:hypothetical protein